MSHPILRALVLALPLLLGAAPGQASDAPRELVSPPGDAFFQRGPKGTAVVAFALSPGKSAAAATLAAAGKKSVPRTVTVGAGKTAGAFVNVRPGVYALCLKGRPETCRTVGVGELFLVAGQSNAVSHGKPGVPYASATGMVAVTARTEDKDARPYPDADPGVVRFPTPDHPVETSVCWLRLGDMLAEKYKVPVGFVIVARSNTNTDCWNPQGGACWPEAAKALAAHRFRAVLWHQGESDVLGGLPMEKSLANMRAMVEASREIQPDIPWIVARNSLKNGTPYADQPIRRAQETLIASGAVLAGPDTDVIRDHPDWVGVADFGGEGLTRHGELWFAPVDRLLGATLTKKAGKP